MSKHYCGPNYDDEYISEEEFARSEGFYLDDDGHWVPMDDDEMLDDAYHSERDINMDTDDNVEYMSEIEFAHSEGFYVDDDGHWIPEEDVDW